MWGHRGNCCNIGLWRKIQLTSFCRETRSEAAPKRRQDHSRGRKPPDRDLHNDEPRRGERFDLSIVFCRPFGACCRTEPSRGLRASRLPPAGIFGPFRGLKSSFATDTRLGVCPRNRRGRAHGACTASARREEEAISMHIVDDEQRSDRGATPMRPSGSGRCGGICGVGAPRRCTPTSPASRRLASAPAAPGTRPLLILGQAPRASRRPLGDPIRGRTIAPRSSWINPV